jgi:hypothetical protein
MVRQTGAAHQVGEHDGIDRDHHQGRQDQPDSAQQGTGITGLKFTPNR